MGSVSATPPCQATYMVPVVASMSAANRQQRTPSAYAPPRLVISVPDDQVCPPAVEVAAGIGQRASTGAAAASACARLTGRPVVFSGANPGTRSGASPPA